MGQGMGELGRAQLRLLDLRCTSWPRGRYRERLDRACSWCLCAVWGHLLLCRTQKLQLGTNRSDSNYADVLFFLMVWLCLDFGVNLCRCGEYGHLGWGVHCPDSTSTTSLRELRPQLLAVRKAIAVSEHVLKPHRTHIEESWFLNTLSVCPLSGAAASFAILMHVQRPGRRVAGCSSCRRVELIAVVWCC